LATVENRQELSIFKKFSLILIYILL